MCLAIPMQVIEVDGMMARCEAKGVERRVSLLLLQDAGVAPGHFVTVHLGHALQEIDAEEARQAWALYDEMLAAAGEAPPMRQSGE
jgi:hydrogenase expression/formation protein HypC